MLRRPVFALVALVFAAAALHAAGPQFWRLEGTRAFLEGDIEGLSLDSDGRLRLGASPRPLFDPEAPNAWCVARDSRGVLYVGTGNDGRVLRVDAAKGSVLFDAAELEVHAVAVGPDDRVYAATSPDGAVYAIDAAGKATRFFDPPETYIWALAFDPKGALYVATGGEGRVHRVSADGKSETVLTSTETHILSLAADARGRVYAGSAPEGLVYRIDGPGKVFVLLDSAFREIKASRPRRGRQPVRGGHRRADGRVPGEADPRALRLRGRRGRGDGQRELRGGAGLGRRPGHRGARGDGRGGGPGEGRSSPHPPHRRDRHPVELARRRSPLPGALRRRRPRRHREQGQGLPRRRRRPLGARRDAARGAGDGLRARLLGECGPRDREPGPRLLPRRHARRGGDASSRR